MHFGFLLLLLELVRTQDSGTGGYLDLEQGGGGSRAAGEFRVGCQEGLKYMKFLRKDIR